MALSLASLWTETRSFIRRESALIIPLALATFGLGQAVSILVFGIANRSGWNSLLIISMGAAILWTQVGYLSVSALVLKSGTSVGEALSRGLSRLPLLIIIIVIMSILIAAVTIPFSIAAQMNGINLSQPGPAGPTASLVVALPIALIMLFTFAKLYLLFAALVDRRDGAMKITLHAYSLTRGRTLLFLGIALIFILLFQIVQFLGALVASALFVSLFAAFGSPIGGAVMVALTAGIAASFPMVLSSVFSALLYRRLSDQKEIGSGSQR